MITSFFDRLSGSAENKVPPLAKTEGSGQDKLNAVQAEHNLSNAFARKGVCFSPRSALQEASKDDLDRSGSAVRTSLCAGGHEKNSGVRARNEPRALREEGIDRNPLPLGMGRFNWHHKWLWVKKSWIPFDPQEARRWSAKYLPLIAGTPSGSARVFASQLSAAGLKWGA